MTDNKYVIECSKNARAKCKNTTCKQLIPKGSLRIGKVTKNPFDENGDSKLTNWYHAACLFDAQTRMRSTTKKAESEDDLEGFDSLDDDAQEQVRQMLAGKMPPKDESKKASGVKKSESKTSKKKKLVESEDEDSDDD